MRLDPAAASPPARLAPVDMARGAALAGMVVYHLVWDLGFYGLVPEGTAARPFWLGFARLVAGSFLVLVGVSLALAARGGIAPRGFVCRLGRIVAAAMAITLATRLALGEAYVFFGILHCIALSSVLALPFLRAPPWLVGAAALAVLALPVFVAHPLFDTPALQWVGLGTRVPWSNDYVPVFPWFGAVLAGLAAARAVLAREDLGQGAPGREGVAGLAFRAARARAGRLLAWAGRHSLIIYLVHQPLLLALLYPLSLAAPPAEMRGFARACESRCEEGGEAAAVCRTRCACMGEAVQAEDLWEPLARGEAGDRMAAIARQCRAE